MTCPRCCKSNVGIHTCTPTEGWGRMEQEIERLRHELEKLSRNDLPGMCEAFDRVIEAYHSKAHPFHNPLADDARTALRVLRGICSTITALAAKGET